ncbi:alpha/beta fold hydrolase [Paenibacillus daejeonensis]|uniref:alpha/beta fold hydrolase n=1 Tax=Paenibacillus daejeonensis TaxID=135193 RepID=UPI0003702463|nr:alpha/beta hydrolase [Paenibacillus daejeonensis]
MGHYIEVEPHVKLYVEDIGSGPAVLFIHGWPLNHKMFEYQLTSLSRQGYRVLGLDLRGFGCSDAPATGYSYDRLADDVRAVIDHLQLEHVTLVGFSVGGAIATRYMARHGQHGVAKLALLGAAVPCFTQREGYQLGMTQEEMNEQIAAVQKDRPKMLEEFGDIFLSQGSGSRKVSKAFQNWLHQLGLAATPWGTIGVGESLRDEELFNDLSAITVPTTLFHGKLDKICPPEFAELQLEGIPGASLVTFEHSGHGMLFDEPEKFDAALLDFLKSTT